MRTTRARVRAVSEYRGAEVEAHDDDLLVRSDRHLGHATSSTATNDPFLDVEDQYGEISRAWERIDAGAVLVVFGVVAMGDAVSDATSDRVRRAPGREKHLVIGNHDVTGAGEVRTAGCDPLWSVLTSAGDPPRLWTHYPLLEIPEGCVNVHGRTHASPPAGTAHINVSVEQLEYEPVRLSRVRRLVWAIAHGGHPPGASTIEQIAHIEQMETYRT